MARVSAIIVKEEKILLIHRKKLDKEYWVFPGGHVEAGETPKDAVKREVKEETNLEVTSSEEKLNYKTKNEFTHYAYICQVKEGKLKLGGNEAKQNSEEDWFNPEWVDLKEMKKLKLYPEEVKNLISDK